MANEGADSNDAVVGSGDEVTINIRCSNSSKFAVKVNLEMSVEGFKSVISENCDVPAHQQRLIYKGRILKDDQTLASYGLQEDHTVHMVRGIASASANPAGGINSAPATTRSVGSNEAGTFGGNGLGASQFPGLGINGLGSNGAPGMLGAGIPDFEQVQQQLTQNPTMMREIMNSPVIQNLMNNPDIMRNMIMSNPQMREIIDRNPELGHILNDPSTLRQTLEAARSPELMREMMRNTDRAMSNIESSPEGFNMLRRMYENVQEPLLNATTMGEGGNGVGSNPFATLLGNQVGGQAIDRATNPSTPTETTAGSPAPNTNPLPNPWNNAGGGSVPTNSTRSSPPVPGSGGGLGGLGGLGLPDMFGGMQDPSAISNLMQDPAMSQMMQSMLSNPQYMNQMISQHPQIRSLVDSNPQLREMMQNPDFIRQLTSPEMMQQVMGLQQSLLGRQQPAQGLGQTGAGAGSMGLDSLMNMFGGLGSGGLAAPVSNVPPEELYATQLAQLREMGFFDPQENIQALRATSGNVNAAVERLLNNLG